MATWTDRQRGTRQGRIKPPGIIPPGGEYTFVLGSIDDEELAALTPGDYTEVQQTVDLTDVDTVSATMDTIGKLASQFQPPAGWQDDSDTIFLYNFDSSQLGAFPRHSPGFPLVGAGQLEIGSESYSPSPTASRVIPPFSTGAQEQAIVDPQIFPASIFPLFQWTAEAWVNFDSDSLPSSWGVDPSFFYCREPSKAGLSWGLSGATGPGAHSWLVYVTVFNGSGGVSGTGFPGYVINTPSPGWHLFGVVFDFFAFPSSQRLSLYVDGVLIGYSFSAPIIFMDQPPAVGSPFTIADPLLWGGFDAQRMRNIAASPAQMLDSYNECVALPPAVDFKWMMQVWIDSTLYAEREISPSERRRWTDMIVPVRRLLGNHDVKFRLSFEEA